MTDVIVTVDQEMEIVATVSQTDLTLSSSNLANPAVLESMSDIADVDTTVLENGSVLVYKTNTNKWTSTRTLDRQNLEGGEF